MRGGRWAHGRADDARRDFDIMFFSHPLPVWIYDLDSLVFLDVNPAAVARYGYSREEFRAKRILDIRPVEDAERLERQIRAGRFPQRSERWRHRVKDGTLIDVDVTAHVTTYEGRPAVLSLVVDRSDSERLTRELRESEERFRILASMPEEYAFAIAVRGEGYELLWATQGLQRDWGLSAARMSDPAGPLACFHPEDPDAAAGVLATLLGGGSVDATIRVLGEDGDPRWGRFVCSPILGYGGRVVRIVGAVHDITAEHQAQHELEETEARYRQIFENSLIGITRSTIDGVLLNANDAAARLLGFENVTELLTATSRYPASLAHPEDRQRIFEILKRDGEVRDFEIRVRHRDGQPRWIACTARLVRGPDGAIVDGTFVDVTDRKRAADEAYRRYEALVELDATRRSVIETLESARVQERLRIARELHDELGQKLTTASLLAKSIEGATGQAAKALRSLLEEALASTRKLVASIRSVPESRGLEPLLAALASEAGGTGIDVDLHVQEGNVPLARETEGVVYRVAQEALTNTVRHARARSASIVLTRENGSVVLIVEDDGGGFDVAAIEAAQNGGTHFGLLGIRERARELGATVDIESRPGAGTRIRFKIPDPAP